MPHHFSTRVYYEDTDMAGIVYYANYLKYIERARSAWIADLGIDQKRLKDQEGIVFAVRRVEADYLKPAVFDDVLSVTTMLAEIKPARLFLAQDISRDGEVLFRSKVTIIAMDLEGRPKRLPALLQQKLQL